MSQTQNPNHAHPATPSIILFDGICVLCESSVRFVIKHDPNAHFKFAALQSKTGQRILSEHDIDASCQNSVVLIQLGQAYFKSDAALAIAAQLKGPWKYLKLFKYLPKRLRDAVYDFIAQRRYRRFGKNNTCIIPDKTIRERFL